MSAQAHAEMVAAVAPFIDTAISQDRQRAGRLPVRGLPGPVPAGLGRRAEGPGHLPAERGARLGAERRGAAGAADARIEREPAPRARPPAGAGARLAALAGPARAAGRQRGVDLHDRAPVRRLRALRRRTAGRRRVPAAAARSRSRSGSTAPSSRAAWARWPRRCRWTCAPTTPPGCSSSSTRWPRWPRSARSRCRSRRTASSACSPAWWRPPRR